MQAGLLAAGFMPPLRDAAGVAYEPAALPCTTNPTLWDDNGLLPQRAQAAYLCVTGCPALEACDARRRELGSLARGVMAGQIIYSEDSMAGPHYDATVAYWLTLVDGGGSDVL